MEFKTRGKYPYTRFLTLFFLAVVFSGLVILLGIDIVYVVVVFAAILPPMLLFSISPLLTRHTVGPRGITLRQGWYFSAHIPAANIKEMEITDEDAPPRSLSYSPRRRRLFVTLSVSPLVRLELRDSVRMSFSSSRPVQTVVVSVDDPEGFLDEAERAMQVKVIRDRLCPHCRQPLAVAKPAEAKAGGKPIHPRIEYLFLIHHDGRLIFQFAGGRLQALSTASLSGMMVVIQDFIRDAFKTEGGALRKLEHGDLTVLIESGSLTYLAVVVSGQEVPEDLRQSMRRVLKETEQEYAELLRSWDGQVPAGIGKVVSQVLWS